MGGVKHQDGPAQCGFAAAGFAHQGHNLAPPDFQIGIPHRMHRAKATVKA